MWPHIIILYDFIYYIYIPPYDASSNCKFCKYSSKYQRSHITHYNHTLQSHITVPVMCDCTHSITLQKVCYCHLRYHDIFILHARIQSHSHSHIGNYIFRRFFTKITFFHCVTFVCVVHVLYITQRNVTFYQGLQTKHQTRAKMDQRVHTFMVN